MSSILKRSQFSDWDTMTEVNVRTGVNSQLDALTGSPSPIVYPGSPDGSSESRLIRKNLTTPRRSQAGFAVEAW